MAKWSGPLFLMLKEQGVFYGHELKGSVKAYVITGLLALFEAIGA